MLASIIARKLGAFADQIIEMVIAIIVPLPAGISAQGTYPSVSKWIIKRKFCLLYFKPGAAVLAPAAVHNVFQAKTSGSGLNCQPIPISLR